MSDIKVEHVKDIVTQAIDTAGPNEFVFVQQLLGSEDVSMGFLKRSRHSGQNMTICVVGPKDMSEDVKIVLKTLGHMFQQKHQK